MSQLKKKNPLKSRKQKLIDRINQCKSLKEIEGWEKTFSYHSILKNDEQWDYRYLLDLIEFKLIKMRDYFWTHDIVEGEKQYGNICNNLIKILNAGYKTDIITEDELESKNIYVNSKNVERFIPKETLEFLSRDSLIKYWNPNVRAEKAKALFWKYFEHHIEKLWD